MVRFGFEHGVAGAPGLERAGLLEVLALEEELEAAGEGVEGLAGEYRGAVDVFLNASVCGADFGEGQFCGGRGGHDELRIPVCFAQCLVGDIGCGRRLRLAELSGYIDLQTVRLSSIVELRLPRESTRQKLKRISISYLWLIGNLAISHVQESLRKIFSFTKPGFGQGYLRNRGLLRDAILLHAKSRNLVRGRIFRDSF